MAVTTSDRALKALAVAVRPTTPDNEAVAAVRRFGFLAEKAGIDLEAMIRRASPPPVSHDPELQRQLRRERETVEKLTTKYERSRLEVRRLKAALLQAKAPGRPPTGLAGSILRVLTAHGREMMSADIRLHLAPGEWRSEGAGHNALQALVSRGCVKITQESKPRLYRAV